MLDYDIVILGAGVSGLSAAFHASHIAPNKRILVLEGSKRIGGQSGSKPIESQLATEHGVFTTHEMGIHTLFTNDSYVASFYDSLGVVRQPRNAKIVIKTDPLVVVDYPYQANVKQLPEAMRYEQPIRDSGMPQTSCFANELLKTYGQTHCDNFFHPYNGKKFGSGDIYQLPPNWGQRKHVGQETGKGHCPEVVYPKDRDFQAMPDALHARSGKNVDFRFECNVPQEGGIDTVRRTIQVINNGPVPLYGTGYCTEVIRYKTLINTTRYPLTEHMYDQEYQKLFTGMFKPAYCYIYTVVVDTANVVDPGVHWHIVADGKLGLLRVANHNALRSIPEHGKTLLVAEVTENDVYHHMLLPELQQAGIIKDPVGMFGNKHIRTGILYSQDAREQADAYIHALKKGGVWCIGRFGRAEYLDCDECILDGRQAAMEATS